MPPYGHLYFIFFGIFYPWIRNVFHALMFSQSLKIKLERSQRGAEFIINRSKKWMVVFLGIDVFAICYFLQFPPESCQQCARVLSIETLLWKLDIAKVVG